MFQKLKIVLAGFLALATLLAPLAVTTSAAAADCTTGNSVNIQGCEKTGACLSTSQASCQAAADPNGSINRILATVINIFSLVVGIIAVIMIIIGGIRFVLSGGDSGATATARNTILYAIIGLVVVALAQVIVHFVLNRVTGSS